MLVCEAVGATLAGLGVATMFGVVGSGNFHVTSALVAQGARYFAARHECGAASMADGWARLAGRPGILSVHQGPGLTNALTGITEAAKIRTPMLVLAADVAAAAVRSNFRIDVAAMVAGAGATPARLHSPAFAVDDTVRAYRIASCERRTVVLALPLDVQAGDCTLPAISPVEPPGRPGPRPRRYPRWPMPWPGRPGRSSSPDTAHGPAGPAISWSAWPMPAVRCWPRRQPPRPVPRQSVGSGCQRRIRLPAGS
jgi:thiamine pyrophosphate-dependent acetolactate synthase large subunit-like protein